MIRPRRVLELHSDENVSAAGQPPHRVPERGRQKSGGGGNASRSPVTTPCKKARHLSAGSRPKTTTHWQWSPAKNRFCPQFVEYEDGQIAMNCERPQPQGAPMVPLQQNQQQQQQQALFNPQDIQFRSKWQSVSSRRLAELPEVR